MIQPTISLIDVLTPPANQWLRDLARRKTNLPPGVRVVRFSEENDEAADSAAEVSANSRPG